MGGCGAAAPKTPPPPPAATLTGGRAGTRCIATKSRGIMRRNGRVTEEVGVIQATYRGDTGSKIGRKAWLRGVGIKDTPIRGQVIIDRDPKTALIQHYPSTEIDKAVIRLRR